MTRQAWHRYRRDMDYYEESRLRSPLVIGIIVAIVAAVASALITAWVMKKDQPDIAANQVVQADIAPAAVGRDQIANGAISADKLAADAITGDAIPDASIDEAKIAESAVGTAQLKDGAITAAKVAPGVVKSLDAAIAKAQKEAATAEGEAQTAEKDAKAAANAYVPTVTMQSKSFSGAQGTIACPSGAIAIAGGVTVNNESVNIVSSYPSGRNGAQPTGWSVMLSGSGGGQVYVTCLK